MNEQKLSKCEVNKPERARLQSHGQKRRGILVFHSRLGISLMVNRGRIEIMAHILGLCTKPQVKTRIMYNANIAFRQFEIYAALLKSQDLLAHEANRYEATERGLQFINAFTQLQNAIDGSDSRDTFCQPFTRGP